jgi:hypothetical protein
MRDVGVMILQNGFRSAMSSNSCTIVYMILCTVYWPLGSITFIHEFVPSYYELFLEEWSLQYKS